MSTVWNLWHGCHKKSEGCKHCYVYRHDAKYEIDSNIIKKNKVFDLPIIKDRKGNYKVRSGEIIYTCFTSDFFLKEADNWRSEGWDIIRMRSDCTFIIVTKRIERFLINLPSDWKEGWDNVVIYVTCENQKRADERLPILNELPIKHKGVICEPILEKIDLSKYLTNEIEEVVVGGESGSEARICDFDWVMSIRKQCIDKDVVFTFKQTGARFVKDSKEYRVLRKYQHSQARKANLDYIKKN